MTRFEHAKALKKAHNLDVSVAAICSRLQRGWTDEQIIARPHPIKSTAPPYSHPLKRNSFAAMALRKGWKTEIK